MTAPRAFDVPRFLQLLRDEGCALGEPFTYLVRTESTNDVAKAAARTGAAAGATFLAEHQTAGRGRRGRTWYAPSGESLLFSVVMAPKLLPDQFSALTLAVGLGVRESLAAACDSELLLKWPNDVYANDGKLAGILVESEVTERQVTVVVGVGINVSTQTFPDEIAPIATSVTQLGGTAPREEILANVLPAVHRWVHVLETDGVTRIAEEVTRFDALRDREVLVEGVRARARGIDARGQLLIESDDRIRAVASGTVEIQR